MNDNKLEILMQLFEVSMRINLETDLACWVSVSGHVGQIQVEVAESKELFMRKMTKHSTYYGSSHTSDEEFFKAVGIALKDLNNLLSAKWTKQYTAYCNLIDMSCNQVFTSEEAAQSWVTKMKRKYSKVNAIVGYYEGLQKS